MLSNIHLLWMVLSRLLLIISWQYTEFKWWNNNANKQTFVISMYVLSMFSLNRVSLYGVSTVNAHVYCVYSCMYICTYVYARMFQ